MPSFPSTLSGTKKGEEDNYWHPTGKAKDKKYLP